MKFWPFALALLGIISCQKSVDPRNDDYPTTHSIFEKGVITATIQSDLLMEASGLQHSTANPGHLWAHNDSGGQPSIYLIDTLGQLKLTVCLIGAKNVDWEDITSDGEHLYIAEIGDNRAERKALKILMLEEPILENVDSISISNWLEMNISYANGPRDAETLIYDYRTKELVIVSKREEACYVYAFPFEANQTKELQPTGQVNLTMFTAGDSNAKGEILVKNYDAIFYWSPSELPIAERLTQGPDFNIPYELEPQGEAIAFVNQSFYTLSEFNQHSQQHLYVYRRISHN